MNIVFMGTPSYAVNVLLRLAENFNILGVYTQPDKPVGRKQILTPSEVKIYAQENLPNVPVFTPQTLRNEAVVAEISALKPDFIIVAAYGKILPKAVLDIAPCINLHASILPKYRGASPIQAALLNGDEETGVTAMLMNEGLDTGDMLDFAYTNCKGKTSEELFNELGEMGGLLIVDVLKNYQNLNPIKQNEDEATYCKKIQKSDGEIDFNQSAESIYDKFRAFTPWPGIFTKSGLKLLKIELCDNNYQSAVNGEIVEISKSGFVVSCADKSLKIVSLQESGKKCVDAKSFINGKHLNLGDLLN